MNRKQAAKQWAAREQREAASQRISRKVVEAAYWIEPSNANELATDPQSPYRMVTDGGQRYGLSTLDAIRAQKEGLPFRVVDGGR